MHRKCAGIAWWDLPLWEGGASMQSEYKVTCQARLHAVPDTTSLGDKDEQEAVEKVLELNKTKVG